MHDFIDRSDWFEREALRPLSHIAANWELQWDYDNECYLEERDSYARPLNRLIAFVESMPPPPDYHAYEDKFVAIVQRGLKWGIQKKGHWWVHEDGRRISRDDYGNLVSQGGFAEVSPDDLIPAIAGRVRAARHHRATTFDEMDEGHQVALAGVITAYLYHQSPRR